MGKCRNFTGTDHTKVENACIKYIIFVGMCVPEQVSPKICRT